jgi:hypothetical protein
MVINDNEDTQQLSSEEIALKIADLGAQKAAADLARSQEEARRLQAQEALQETNAEITLKAAIGATGVEFHNSASELKSLLTKVLGYSLTFSNRGDSVRVLSADGKQTTLESALESLVVAYPYLANHDTTRHLVPRNEQGEFSGLSRSAFKTVASKSRFISENPGKWETLPQYPTKKAPTSQLTAREYSRLGLSEKSRLISEIGEAGVAEILRRKS